MPVNPDQNELEFQPDEQSWRRMVREPPKAYYAFSIYRDLGPTRSLVEAYRLWRQREESGMLRGEAPALPLFRAAAVEEGVTPSAAWKRWREAWRWDERSTAYDDHMEDRQQKLDDAVLQEIRRKRLAERLQLDEEKLLRIRKMHEVIDVQLASEAGLVKQRQEKELNGTRTSVEMDRLRIVEVLVEKASDLEAQYFSILDGTKESSGNPRSDRDAADAVATAAEFTWVEDPERSQDTAPAAPLQIVEGKKVEPDP